MFAIFIRFVIILFALVLQFSVLSFGSYVIQGPSLILVLALAWTIILGFSRATGWLVAMGILSDLYFSQPVGYSVIIFVVIGYGVSFLSRRYLVEHRFWGNVVLTGLIIFGFALYVSMQQIFLKGFSLDLSIFMELRVWREIILVIVVNGLLFWMVYKILNSIERYLSFYERKIHPKNYA